MKSDNNSKKWLSSKEVKIITKIKGCDLMHSRVAGELEFKKKGNTYFYSEDSVEKIKRR